MSEPVRDYGALVRRVRESCRMPTARLERIGQFDAQGSVYELYEVLIGRSQEDKPSVMIDAGIHGDEPAGVEAAVRFVERASGDAELHSRFSFAVFFCNNPTGWERNTRENWIGVDLNRRFATSDPEPEVRIISEALRGRCFDLVFEMHEDVDSPGFYLYEISENRGEHAGEEIVRAMEARGVPINRSSEIEGRVAEGGVIRAGVRVKRFRRTRLPLAIFAYRACGGHVITLEPPASVLPFEDRVQIELIGLDIALKKTAESFERRKHAA